MDTVILVREGSEPELVPIQGGAVADVLDGVRTHLDVDARLWMEYDVEWVRGGVRLRTLADDADLATVGMSHEDEVHLCVPERVVAEGALERQYGLPPQYRLSTADLCAIIEAREWGKLECILMAWRHGDMVWPDCHAIETGSAIASLSAEERLKFLTYVSLWVRGPPEVVVAMAPVNAKAHLNKCWKSVIDNVIEIGGKFGAGWGDRAVDAALAAGMPLDEGWGGWGTPLIQCACKLGSGIFTAAAIRSLVEGGADVNVRTYDLKSVLLVLSYQTAHSWHMMPEVVNGMEVILQAGVDPNGASPGARFLHDRPQGVPTDAGGNCVSFTALQNIIRRARFKLEAYAASGAVLHRAVRLLLDAGANVYRVVPRGRQTVLHHAAKQWRRAGAAERGVWAEAMLMVLAHAQADATPRKGKNDPYDLRGSGCAGLVAHRDRLRNTALHIAAGGRLGLCDADRTLLEALSVGGAVDARNVKGRTPLHMAALHQDHGMVQGLLELTCDAETKDSRVNSVDYTGASPLGHAVRFPLTYRRICVVALLLQHGANVASLRPDAALTWFRAVLTTRRRAAPGPVGLEETTRLFRAAEDTLKRAKATWKPPQREGRAERKRRQYAEYRWW